MVVTASIAGAIAQSQNNSPASEEGKQLLDQAEKLLQQGTGESKQACDRTLRTSSFNLAKNRRS